MSFRRIDKQATWALRMPWRGVTVWQVRHNAYVVQAKIGSIIFGLMLALLGVSLVVNFFAPDEFSGVPLAVTDATVTQHRLVPWADTLAAAARSGTPLRSSPPDFSFNATPSPTPGPTYFLSWSFLASDGLLYETEQRVFSGEYSQWHDGDTTRVTYVVSDPHRSYLGVGASPHHQLATTLLLLLPFLALLFPAMLALSIFSARRWTDALRRALAAENAPKGL